MDKLTQDDATSHDIVADNIDKLKAIFPETFTEGKIDFDVLKETLGEYRETREERYNFSWAGKSKARRLAQTPTTGTLRPCPEESVDWDDTENLFIEGDNLEVLKLLQKSYQGQVKMIYIDPPYNTGGDFVYSDKFQDNLDTYLKYTGQKSDEGFKLSSNTESSGRYHTNWLNMMFPRLILARNLLSDRGVIFLSIDENEQNNLKLLCDQIFGEENFIECITWNKRVPKNDKGVGNIHEYILLYAKNAEHKPVFTMRKDGLDDIYDLVEKLKRQRIPLDEAEEEIKKLYNKNGYDRGITLYDSLNSEYQLWGKINMSWPNAETFGPRYEVLHPETNKPVKIPDRGWRWKLETFNEAAGFVDGKYSDIKKLHDGSFMCNEIWFAKDENTQPSSVKLLDDVNTFLLRSILSYKSDGGVEVESLFEGKSFFSYPKPTSLLKAILGSQGSKHGDIYLDFFSGSATTAHALMLLNAEDGIKRRSISIQLPEPCSEDSAAFKAGYRNIADAAKERIRRVGIRVKRDYPSFDGDIGFKAFKLDSSNIEAWDSNIENLEENVLNAANILKDDRSEFDIVYELFLKYGLDLNYPINTHTVAGKQVYEVGAGSLFICLEDGITTDFVEGLIELYKSFDDEAAPRVVFKDSAFKTDAAKKDAESTLKDAGILDVKCL